MKIVEAMTKREMVKEIAKHITGNPQQISRAIEYAVREKTKDRIEQVYQFFVNHREQAGFCMNLLTGIQFKNPEL